MTQQQTQQRLAALARHLSQAALTRAPTSATQKFKVAVLGAAGGIGQPLSLLLKTYPLVGELSLYDIVGTEGVGADLSHMDTSIKVRSFTGPEKLGEALYGCQLVLIPAGVPRKPGMTRDDLFNINAGIVKALCEGVAKFCPSALVAIISNPVNSTVPIAAEVFKRAGTFDPRKLLGVTKLDVLRANTFVAEAAGLSPEGVSVPVIGGHAGVTILPLISQTTPRVSLSEERIQALTARIQDAGTEVVKAKAGKGSATLSMAYAAARFADSCLRALGGEAGVVECAYVASSVTSLPYFASPVRLGPGGVEEFLPLGHLTSAEQTGLQAMQAELTGSIEKGVAFATKGEEKKKSTPTPNPPTKEQEHRGTRPPPGGSTPNGKGGGKEEKEGWSFAPPPGVSAEFQGAGEVSEVGTGSSSQLGGRVMTNPVAAQELDEHITQRDSSLASERLLNPHPGSGTPKPASGEGAEKQPPVGDTEVSFQPPPRGMPSPKGPAPASRATDKAAEKISAPGSSPRNAEDTTGQLYSLQGAERVEAATEEGVEKVSTPGSIPQNREDTTGDFYGPSAAK